MAYAKSKRKTVKRKKIKPKKKNSKKVKVGSFGMTGVGARK